MLKIILPVDFSEGTYKACQYALQFCNVASGSHILLLHCFQDYLADADTDIAPPVYQTPSAAIAESVIHRNESDAVAQLEELYNRMQTEVANNQHIYLERSIVNGSPEDCIPEQVKQFQANLLVMTTEGEAGLARSFFGTVTTKVVEEVKAPVLTVPQDYNGAGINRVLYATDFDRADSQAIAQLQRLLAPVSPSIVCVHVAANEQSQDKAKLQELQQKLQNAPGNAIQFVLLPGDDVAESLLSFVKEENIDLVSLASREHGTWGNLFNQSLAKKLVLESKTPLLIFHGQD